MLEKLSEKQKKDGIINIPERDLSARYKQSRLLDGLVPTRKAMYCEPFGKRLKHGRVELVLENFSFADNPIETMDMLAKIVETDCKNTGVKLHFRDILCQDIGPYLALASIRSDLSRVFLGGDISLPMSKVIAALQLDVALEMELPPVNDNDIWAFPVQRRRASGSSKSTTRHLDVQRFEKISKELVSAINKWLGLTADQKLSIHGRRIVQKIVGETLDNAERHGDLQNISDGEWVLAGFMARRTDAQNESYYRCHLGFLSTGSSVSDSIFTCPEPTKTKMAEYVNRHVRSFGNFKFPKEHLQTVFALQYGVTRV